MLVAQQLAPQLRGVQKFKHSPSRKKNQINQKKEMKLKTTSTLAASVMAALALVSGANAAQISGSINFSSAPGSGVTYQSDLAGTPTNTQSNAVGVKSWGTVQVDSRDGDYSSVAPGSVVTMNATPWIFDPSTPYTPFWTVGNFSFSLSGSAITTQAPGALVVTGTGVVTALDNSFEPTAGTWYFSSVGVGTDPDNNSDTPELFSFAANTTSVAAPSVPDGGTTVALLGVSLLGLHGVRRKLMK
ncbi:MAG: 2-deoxy-D-gluconate-3-dehydrogenase [Verrucomicrobiales bacterium]|nr:2-deoxy-D-gluconate-3-dehydrogenase [Verrucomicrobiales bacterium]